MQRHVEVSALARMLHYITSQTGPMPDLRTGACVGSDDADNWHADQHREARLRAEAKSVCRRCPVIGECRDYALANPSVSGTWGGLTEQERNRIRDGVVLPMPRPQRRLSLIA